MHICVFSFRKYVFAGDRSAQGPVGVWRLHIHKVRRRRGEANCNIPAGLSGYVNHWLDISGMCLSKSLIHRDVMCHVAEQLSQRAELSITASWWLHHMAFVLMFFPYDGEQQCIIYSTHWHRICITWYVFLDVFHINGVIVHTAGILSAERVHYCIFLDEIWFLSVRFQRKWGKYTEFFYLHCILWRKWGMI